MVEAPSLHLQNGVNKISSEVDCKLLEPILSILEDSDMLHTMPGTWQAISKLLFMLSGPAIPYTYKTWLYAILIKGALHLGSLD